MKPETAADLEDLGQQAQKVGFAAGAVAAKKKGETLVLYRILAIGTATVQLGELADGRMVRKVALALACSQHGGFTKAK